jgi:hypothetical protein
VPSWMEIVVTLTVLFTEIWIFRWVINRMPVLRDSPNWVNETKSKQAIGEENLRA